MQSKSEPTSQIHSLICLGALLSEVWIYQKIHGIDQELSQFLRDGIDIFWNTIFQRENKIGSTIYNLRIVLKTLSFSSLNCTIMAHRL